MNGRRLGVTCVSVFGVFASPGWVDDRMTDADRVTSTVQLLPYQAEDYRYQVIGKNEVPPIDFERVEFDDSDFNIGRAAFGGGSGGLGTENCPLQVNANTRWRTNSQLLVRRSVVIPAGARNVRLLLSVDNDVVDVFLNGESITRPISHGGCPVGDEFRIDLPVHEIAFDAENLLVFHVVDRGRESFFDATVLAELPDRALVRVLEDATRSADEQTPQIVSVSALTIDECAPPNADGETKMRARFVVDGTGAQGEAVVTVQRGQVRVNHMVDGQRAYVSVQTGQRARVVVADAVPQRARVQAVNHSSFAEVLSRPRTIAALTSCIAANDHIVNPGETCVENANVAETSCKLVCIQEDTAANTECGNISSLACALRSAKRQVNRDACLDECANAGRRLRRACP